MRAPELWKKRGLQARLLAPLGALYGLSVAFKTRRAKPFDPGIPVIWLTPTRGRAVPFGEIVAVSP